MNHETKSHLQESMIELERRDGKSILVQTFHANLLDPLKVSSADIKNRIEQNQEIFKKIGKDYYYKELVGKVVLLSRNGFLKNGDERYYFNSSDEIGIAIKNIAEYYSIKNEN
jgi:hypothetical protein